MPEGILYSYKFHWNAFCSGNHFGYRTSKASDDTMFLCGYDRPCFSCCFHNHIPVNRFDRMHIDHSRMDALFCQLFFCFERFLHHQATGDNRHITAIHQLNPFPYLELIIFKLITYTFYRSTPCSQITWALRIKDCSCCQSHFIGITRHNNCHPRNCTHQTDIFNTLMCRTIFSHGKAAMTSNNFYIEFRVRDIIPHLIINSSGCKNCKGMYQSCCAACCKSCCHIHHIRFCDSKIVKPFRVFFGKIFCHCTVH